jgi:hypothetical protein
MLSITRVGVNLFSKQRRQRAVIQDPARQRELARPPLPRQPKSSQCYLEPKTQQRDTLAVQ